MKNFSIFSSKRKSKLLDFISKLPKAGTSVPSLIRFGRTKVHLRSEFGSCVPDKRVTTDLDSNYDQIQCFIYRPNSWLKCDQKFKAGFPGRLLDWSFLSPVNPDEGFDFA